MTPRTSTSASSRNDDSAVMRELKEKILAQAAEIDKLKKQLAPKKSVSGGHGAHGGGEEEDVQGYLQRSFFTLASHRVGWLGLFLCSLSLTAIIMNGFEHTLSRQIELAYFVPLLAGHGGNTGGQTVGTVLSALSERTIKLSDAPRIVFKEASSGLVAGTILGVMVGPIAHFVMGISLHVSAVVTCTLPLTSTIAGTLGSTIPFLCLLLGIDPALVSAPAMTSFVDVAGLLCYFILAKHIFALFDVDF
eukprot:CAMPEP_0195272738 /NCGR_PEP_ID=MMETSP0706-20130129/16003_1 /TAXON_ID=33640 /ORGANISM="Asterionellopsis glacialis, Strain CCMP134" /LENGTH=247 /DNA_ID=CAMNT_0040329015 /DNA_START=262 /DNA_END=1005 /DNA_ORIENTATION=+